MKHRSSDTRVFLPNSCRMPPTNITSIVERCGRNLTAPPYSFYRLYYHVLPILNEQPCVHLCNFAAFMREVAIRQATIWPSAWATDVHHARGKQLHHADCGFIALCRPFNRPARHFPNARTYERGLPFGTLRQVG